MIQNSLLLVDDDERFRRSMAFSMANRGFRVTEASGVTEAKGTPAPAYAVVDLRMPGDNGLELVTHFHTHSPLTKTVVLTGYGSIATALEAVRRGAFHYLTKPVDADELMAALGGKAPGTTGELDQVPSLARVEWEHIHRVLRDCGGNISEAARRLGLHRKSLQRKLSKYPVDV